MTLRVLKTLGLAFVLLIVVVVIWPEAKHEIYTPDADYLADSANYNLPDLPPDWDDFTYTASDGTVIRWGETGNRVSAKATVIFVPGYTSSVDMYGYHVNQIASRGYHVVGIDLRGQGQSQRHRTEQPEKLFAESFKVYASDLAGLISAQNFGADKPLILLGSSFGGHISLLVAGDFDVPVSGLVLLAPAYEPNTAPLSLAMTRAVVGLAQLLGKAERYAVTQGPWRPDGTDLSAPSDCSSYPERLYLRDTLYVRDPSQRVGGATNQYLADLIDSGRYLQNEDFEARVQIPVHMIAAETDIIINSKISEEACTDGLPRCELRVFPNTGHCLTLENDAVQQAIFDTIDINYAVITIP